MTSYDTPIPAQPASDASAPVLILHEDPVILAELTRSINSLGFINILSLKNSEEAMEESRRKKISFFICAYETENIEGLRFLNLIRKKSSFIYTPFFLTDDQFTSLKVMKAGYAGVSGLIVVPFSTKILQEKLFKNMRVKKDPIIQKTETQVEKGTALIDAGKNEEGIKELKSVLDQKEGPEYHYNIGYIRSIQKKYPEAIDAFKKATQMDRLFAKAYEAMARAYIAMGREDLADTYMHHAAQIYMEREQDGHAEDILKEMLELGYESLNVFNSLGIIYRKRGDHKKSMAHYTKALKIHPNEPNIYYNMGRICMDMKDMEKARILFERAVTIKKDFKEARQILKAMDLGIL
ncbi:tetratricopeptide repeat protein [Desulfobotulus mexicanus]|uniref:Tetratricopeptide repeat protein n=1 Tax=Desulfobotulus mexicanus TaxID=2586642 RepID=A0A5S5MCZ1_9BACT|nr:tetratricopeptide repeat protein [Desulfobotulus mexicanus]TYT73583.1 tetratricopeptide repeat protein [Desulfobotulus mexicanus]